MWVREVREGVGVGEAQLDSELAGGEDVEVRADRSCRESDVLI